MKARPPQVVALDLGGVLFSVQPLAVPSVDAAALTEALFGHGEHGEVQAGRLLPGTWLARAAARLTIAPEPLREAWMRRFELAPGADLLLRALEGLDTVVWSNLDPLHWSIAESVLPPSMSDEARRALSFELGVSKPEAAFFRQALERAGHGQVLFLDDNAENVFQAREAGARASVVRGPIDAAEHVSKAFVSAL